MLRGVILVKKTEKTGRPARWKTQLELQSMVIPVIVWLVIFCYVPMAFTAIAFQDYNLIEGLAGSQWVGLKHFRALLTDSSFLRVMGNTFGINLLGLAVGFPAPIVFALLLNELTSRRFTRLVQTATYIPYFFSWAVFGGLVINFLSPSTGFLNDFLLRIGVIGEKINFMANPDAFWGIAMLSSLVKNLGYSAIIYIAAIAGVDPSLFEAARIDGAGRFKVIWYVTLPCISGTVVIMLIFSIAGILNTGIEQILVMQNIMNLARSETLDTYVYKIGMQQMNFSYATAVGLFKSVVAVVLLTAANMTSKKISGKGLF